MGAFAVAENKVAGADFVSESFALLGEAKGKTGVESIDDVFVVCENTLGGLGTKIGDVFGFGFVIVVRKNGANVGGKHHIEFADRSPVLFAADGAFGVSI